MALDNTYDEGTDQTDEQRKQADLDSLNQRSQQGMGFTSPDVPVPGFQAPASPAGAWNREQFKNEWMSKGGNYGYNPEAFINANQQFSQGVKALPGSSGDKWILPSGEVMDLSINYNSGTKSGSGAGWTGIGGWNGSSLYQYPAEGGGGTPAAAAPAASASSGQSAMSAEMLLKQQQDEALRKKLIDQFTQRADQSLAIDRNDPTIRAQADAYSANEERSKRNYLADLAEQTGPNANLRGETRMASERVGQRTGGFEADLMGRELTARRTEISNALESMRGMLTTEQEMSLREKLAQMDDAIQRAKLAQDQTQFTADMGYKNAALGQQGQIANNQLGLQYDQFDWERSPLNPRNILQS